MSINAYQFFVILDDSTFKESESSNSLGVESLKNTVRTCKLKSFLNHGNKVKAKQMEAEKSSPNHHKKEQRLITGDYPIFKRI